MQSTIFRKQQEKSVPARLHLFELVARGDSEGLKDLLGISDASEAKTLSKEGRSMLESRDRRGRTVLHVAVMQRK